MAKITYGNALGNLGELESIYDDGLQLQAGKSNSEKVVFKDTGVGSDKIIVTGSGFEWQDGSDILGFGEINGIRFTTKSGDATYMTFTGLSLEVGAFNEAYLNEGVQGVIDLLTSGHDQITGSNRDDIMMAGAGRDLVRGGKGADTIGGGTQNDRLFGEAGNDYIWGDSGTDRMWGGSGSDRFQFQSGDGKDTIVDFDAKGGGNKQDYLRLYEGETFTIEKSGKDLILDFGDGDTLTLLDVKRADFSRNADIDWIMPL